MAKSSKSSTGGKATRKPSNRGSILGPHAPTSHLALPIGGEELTVVEITVFLTRYLRSFDVCGRVTKNGVTRRQLGNMVAYHRILPKPLQYGSIGRMLEGAQWDIHGRVKESGTNWTIRDATKADLTNWDASDLSTRGYQLNFERQGKSDLKKNSLSFEDLAIDVESMPQGHDALYLTRCVEYAVLHPGVYRYPRDFEPLIQLTGGPIIKTPEYYDGAAGARWEQPRAKSPPVVEQSAPQDHGADEKGTTASIDALAELGAGISHTYESTPPIESQIPSDGSPEIVRYRLTASLAAHKSSPLLESLPADGVVRTNEVLPGLTQNERCKPETLANYLEGSELFPDSSFYFQAYSGNRQPQRYVNKRPRTEGLQPVPPELASSQSFWSIPNGHPYLDAIPFDDISHIFDSKTDRHNRPFSPAARPGVTSQDIRSEGSEEAFTRELKRKADVSADFAGDSQAKRFKYSPTPSPDGYIGRHEDLVVSTSSNDYDPKPSFPDDTRQFFGSTPDQAPDSVDLQSSATKTSILYPFAIDPRTAQEQDAAINSYFSAIYPDLATSISNPLSGQGIQNNKAVLPIVKPTREDDPLWEFIDKSEW
ncbi:hypothetical protein N0V95_008257 [Ascochyta clinopodiicola]|nr:hypothetical protein N0V95_008257 [Ascochyta clinopodiicola]